MKTGEPVESLSLSKILVLYMRKYQITNDTVHSGYVSYLRGTKTAEVEGLWLVKNPNACVKTPRQQ